MDKIFRWFSGNKKTPTAAAAQDVANTAPLSEQQIQAIVSNQNPRFDLQQLISACGQSVGKQRELNEDSLLTITAMMAGNAGNLPFGLYIVADGMGGHQFGEVASNAAIRTVAGYVLRKFHPYLFHIKTDTMDESFQEIMQAGVGEGQRASQRVNNRTLDEVSADQRYKMNSLVKGNAKFSERKRRFISRRSRIWDARWAKILFLSAMAGGYMAICRT